MEGDMARREKHSFYLTTKEMNSSVNEFIKQYRQQVEKTDVVVFIGDTGLEDQMKVMQEFTDKFNLIKDYTEDFPVYVHSFNLKQQYKRVTCIENAEECCGTIAQDLFMEQKKEKGISESLAHKMGRKRELLRACCASVFVSTIVSIIVAIPGIVIIWKHQDVVSIIFSTVFILLGICELAVGVYLCHYFAKTWYTEDRNATPRYRQTCITYDACC